MWFIASLLCGVVLLIYKCSTWSFSHWKNKNVAGPKPIPFFGNFLRLALNKEYGAVTTANIYRQYPTEKFVGIYRFTVPILLIRDPDIIKHVLIKDFDYFQSRGVEFSKEGLGANLFHSDGDTWNVLRKKLSPLFTTAKIKGMFYLVSDRSKEFLKFVEKLVDEYSVLEVNDFVAKYTAEVIGTCAYGVNIDAFNNKFNKYLDIGRKQFKPTWRMMLDFLVPGILKKLKIDLMAQEVVSHYENVISAIVQEREGKPKIRNDFMDLMIDMKEQGKLKGNKVKSDEEVDLQITESVMAAQAFIFFGAGYETTSTTITLTLYELALNQHIQDRVVNEIAAVLDKFEGKITYEAIGEMKYLDKVVSETLRKYPVIDVMRKTVQNYKIPGTDVTLPKGSHIVIPQLGLNYDPKYYPDPEHFDPERFSPDNIKSIPTSVYIPFGAGPRECIAMRFAQVEVKTCLTHFLQRFRVEPSAKTSRTLVYGARRFTLHVEGGVWLTVKKRS